MKRLAFLFFVTLLIGIFNLSDFVWAYISKSSSYRETLLNFYTQELVTHGIMLFAAITGTFSFITGMIDKTNARKLSGIIFILVTGLLFALVLYIGFRIVVYGALCTGVIGFPISPDIYSSFSSYIHDVSEYTFKGSPLNTTVGITLNRTYGDSWGGGLNLMQNLRRGFREFYRPFSSLPLGIYFGYLFAYLIFYAFKHQNVRVSTSIIWPASLSGFAVTGLLGAIFIDNNLNAVYGWFIFAWSWIMWIALSIILTLLFPVFKKQELKRKEDEG